MLPRNQQDQIQELCQAGGVGRSHLTHDRTSTWREGKTLDWLFGPLDRACLLLVRVQTCAYIPKWRESHRGSPEEKMTTQPATLGARVTQATGQNPFHCYQCGNCSAGCPMAGRGDLLPHQVFRHLQLGGDDPLRAVQPWLCVGCQTCATRCPQELDLSLVMDFLRAEAVQRGTVPRAARRMAAFNHVFLNRILAGGRLREVELGALYNLYTRSPLQNVWALPSLLRRASTTSRSAP